MTSCVGQQPSSGWIASRPSLLLLLPCVIVLALLSAAPERVSSAGGGAFIESVEAGYEFGGGNFRLNGPSSLRPNNVWMPVHVTIRNDGEANLDGTLVVADNGAANGSSGASYRTDYTRTVSLPAGAHKAVTMYVRSADVTSQVAVSLETAGRVVDTRTTSPAPLPPGTLSVGVLSDDTGTRATLRALKFGDTALAVAQFGDSTPLDPQPSALDTFDVIVLSDFSSDTLTAAQQEALTAWVQGGGTLLIAGGADAQKTMAHLAPALLPAILQSSTVVPNVPEVARLAGDTVPPTGQQVEVSIARPAPGARVTVATPGGVPLAIERPLGRGYLVYSALEPTLAPFNTWPVAPQGAYWSHLLGAALTGPIDAQVEDNAQGQTSGGTGPVVSANTITGDLNAGSSHGLPALQVYVFLIALYILALGPANYIVLRWRRRLEWSWVTVPSMAVLFGLGSFGLAYARNGGDVIANVDTVIYLDPGSRFKTADSYTGLFAPAHGDYTLATPGPALAWGLGGDTGVPPSLASGPPLGLTVDEGVPLNARLPGVQMWSLRTVGIQGRLDLPGAVTAHLVLRGSTVSGTITNGTRLALRDCAVTGPDGASPVIPRLGPGQTAAVPAFALNNAGAGNGPLSTLYSATGAAVTGASSGGQAGDPLTRYNAVLGALFPTGSVATAGAPLALVGWSTVPLSPLAINGATPRRSDLDLIVAPLNLTLSPGRFTLQPGDLPVAVVGSTVAPNTVSSGGGITLNGGDHLDVEFTLPRGRRARVRTLSLGASFNSSAASTLSSSSAQLWDWPDGRWVTIDLSGASLMLRHPAPFISSDGRVRLRVQGAPGGVTLNNVDQNILVGASGSAS